MGITIPAAGLLMCLITSCSISTDLCQIIAFFSVVPAEHVIEIAVIIIPVIPVIIVAVTIVPVTVIHIVPVVIIITVVIGRLIMGAGAGLRVDCRPLFVYNCSIAQGLSQQCHRRKKFFSENTGMDARGETEKRTDVCDVCPF